MIEINPIQKLMYANDEFGSLSKLSKQELIAMILQMQNKMESSDTKFAEEVLKLNESFK